MYDGMTREAEVEAYCMASYCIDALTGFRVLAAGPDAGSLEQRRGFKENRMEPREGEDKVKGSEKQGSRVQDTHMFCLPSLR